MSMKRIFSFGLMMMTIAVGAARAAVQAKFHLPFGARWGQMTLAPGDYKVLLPDRSLGSPQFVVKGDERTGYVQPIVTDNNNGLMNDSSRSYLQFVKVNGTYFVAKYRSGATGQVFSFAVPNHKRSEEQDVRRLTFSNN
jgi:hypothetical protein